MTPSRAKRADRMLPHLGPFLRAQRAAKGIKLIRVAYRLDKSESALARFEKGKTWPNDLDAALLAYAAELNTTPRRLWLEALATWVESTADDDGDIDLLAKLD